MALVYMRLLHVTVAAAMRLRSLSFSTLVPLLLVLVLSPRTAESALLHEDLQLAWHDEFNGGSLDWDKWVVDVGDGCDVDLCDWGNGEKQYYRSENAAVSNGTLAITAKKEAFSSRFYTSSKITTKNKFSFRYGRAEARIRLPPGGQGLWPAFWLMPQDNTYGEWAASGEIDVFESRNNFTEVVNNIAFGNAFPNNSNINGDCFLDVPIGTLEEYHVYAMEWDEEEIVWLMDDEETCRVYEWFSTDVKSGEHQPKPAPFDQDFYLILNMAVGGNNDFIGSGGIDDAALPAEMMVDFVRVYQSPEMMEYGDGDGSRSVYLRDATGGGSRQGVEIWGDEFNGSEPSGDWVVASGEVCLGMDTLCANEVQEFDGSAVSVDGGVLELTADAAESGGVGVTTTGREATATSGLLHTMDGFSFMYGRLEANMSAPGVAGVVSTVSLLTVDGGDDVNIGQVDVVSVENGVATGGVWYPEGSISCDNTSRIGYDLDGSRFHTFAVEWTEDRLRWYAGARQYCEVTSSRVAEAGGTWPFAADMYVSVGVSVGRGLGGEEIAVNASLLPATLSVGAIRAHQFNDMEASVEQAASAVGMYEREGNLTWQDEFDGIQLDAASQEEAGEGVMGLEYWWSNYEGDGCELGICGFGNDEAQWYRKENAGIRDGKLSITAKAESYAGNIFTSAKLSTDMAVVMSYGRIETSVKLPKAQGLWPSIWMLPDDSPYGGWASGGAINILEARNDMSKAHGQLTFGGSYPDVEKLDLSEGGHCYSDLHEDLSDDYHVYALEWEVNSFRWYVDGVLYCDRSYWYSRPGPGEEDYPFPAPFDTGFYLIMNVAVGGSFTGGLIDEEALAENPEMLVDYVRVYQLEGQSIFVADPPETSGSGGGGAVSMTTAVSILAVLGILFTLCMTIFCVAKRRSMRAAQTESDDEGGSGANNLDYNRFSSWKTDISPTVALANSVGRSGRGSKSKFPVGGAGGGGRGSLGREHWEQAAADGSTDIHIIVTNRTGVAESSPRSRGAVGTGLKNVEPHMSVVDLRDTAGPVDAPAAVRGGGAGETMAENPLWGRWAGANDNRVDVTPRRLRQNETRKGIVQDGVAERREARMKQPRLPSGTIPEDYALEDEGQHGEVGGGDGGGLDGGGRGVRVQGLTSGTSSDDGGADSSPVRADGVDAIIDEALALMDLRDTAGPVGAPAAVRGGAGETMTENPLWGRWAGANDNRVDVTPRRLRQNETRRGIVQDGVAERRDVRMKQPRLPSGTIPEDYALEDEGQHGEVGRGDGGELDGGGRGVRVQGLTSGTSSDDGGADSSPVRADGVDAIIDEAVALSATVSCSVRSDITVAKAYDGDSRGDEDVWMGGGSMVGSSAGVGQAVGLGYAEDFSDVSRSSSIRSDESEWPPTMPGLTLDAKTIERADAKQTGLPSYEEAIGMPYL